MTKNLVSKKEIVKGFESALKETTNAHNKKAYKFALKMLKNVKDDFKANIRANANGIAYNIGDLGEAIFKHFLTNESVIKVSSSNQTDLNRNRQNEIKTFSSSNRYPNGLKEIEGFYSISEYGIHYITKEIVSKYWDDFRDNKDKKEPTLKILKDILRNEKPNLQQTLTNLMFN